MRGEEELDVVGAVRAEGDGAAADVDAGGGVGDLVLPDGEGHPGVRHGQFGELRGDRVGEAPGGLGAGVGQRLRQLAEFGAQGVALGGELVDAVVVALELGQPGRAPLGPGEDLGDVRAVLAGQVGQRGAALLDGGEAAGVGVQVGGVAGELARDVRQEDVDLADALGEGREGRVVGAHGLQGPVGARDERGGVDALGVLGVAGERGAGGGGRGGEGLGVAEPAGLGGELDVLPGDGLDGGDLVEAEAQQVRLLGALAGARRQLGELGGHGAQAAVGVGVLGEGHGDGVARVPVERLPLPGGAQQPLLVGLAVHGDEVVRQLAQEPHGHAATAHVGARAALGGEGAADEQGAVVQFGARLLGPYGDGRGAVDDQPALDDRRLGADAHERGVGAPAEQQPEAGDDHRLAGAGLAGHRGETGRQLDHRVVNDAQGPDPHLLQHGYDHTRFRGPLATASPTDRPGDGPATGPGDGSVVPGTLGAAGRKHDHSRSRPARPP